MKDAFDTFWKWAMKEPYNHDLTISAELHHAVTSLPREDWHDRERVNAAYEKVKKTVDSLS